MGYQARKKSPRGAIHGYSKSSRERRKDRERKLRRVGKLQEEKQTASANEISAVTFKRLHTLGIQKFGMFPFSEHFDRWLINVESVLDEFESNPNVSVDAQFARERAQVFSAIKQQLDVIRCKEATVNQETEHLTDCKKQLEQVRTEFGMEGSAVRARKRAEIKRLNLAIDALNKELDKVIRIKTGFFRGVSKKEREQQELEIAQKLSVRQRELELVMLEFNAAQERLRVECEKRKEPLREQVKHFQKTIADMDTDSSLEERWLACEALTDAVNTCLLRSVTKQHEDG